MNPPSIPQGYKRLYRGEIKPDDLIWSWCEKKWRRGDDPVWKHKVQAEDCVCVVRKK